jgi:hypothetical protein
MATLANVARERKAQLRQLMIASRKLDASQESLEREVKRLLVRKRSVPELSDAERLGTMAQAVEGALSGMASVIQSVSQSWGMKF